jgi:1-aminocyclopropane-1-carboxylate deaminase/D-cysteine desulfhydrase-like pyridoxal-dependent ACC family enzyme
MKFDELTPVEETECIGFYLKREDFYKVGNVSGGKARAIESFCKTLGNKKGLTTAGGRFSSQIQIASEICKELKIQLKAHVPLANELTDDLFYAKNNNVEIIEHKAGYTNVIKANAIKDAEENNFKYLPWGVEFQQMIDLTQIQVKNIPDKIKRVIVSVGGGMTLCGIIEGRKRFNKKFEIIGIQVGGSTEKRINKWCDWGWRNGVTLLNSKIEYSQKVKENDFYGIKLDEVYEAKCINWILANMEKNDLFWISGKGVH